MPATPHSATAVALVAAALLAACGSGGTHADPPAPPAGLGDTVALTASGRLVSFDRAAPGVLRSNVAVTGLASGERLVGIDQRPADGKLYGLSNAGRLYTLDPLGGVAGFKAALMPAPGDDAPFAALEGSRFGLDFNPVADRLRVTSDSGQNLRINVDTGAAITDGAVNGAPGASVSASAYTNSFAGTTGTKLYVIDATIGGLYVQDPPNAGTLAAPMSLGVTAGGTNGFDIDARDNSGWAALAPAGGAATLHRIDLATGRATAVGPIGGGLEIAGLALMQPARPVVHALTQDGRLLTFDPAAPDLLTASARITGLGATEALLGIDYRPKDGALWGLTSAGRLVTLDAATGAASARASLMADPADTSAPYAGLGGGVFSVDFNPVADRLRVISDTGLNLRINVETGAVTTDGVINRAGTMPVVTGAAYTASHAAAAATRLFDIDTAGDTLALQAPPNDGVLAAVGPLGVMTAGAAPIDIRGGDDGLALAAFCTDGNGPYTLYNLSLATGAATPRVAGEGRGLIGGLGGPAIRDIAIWL